MHIIQYPHPTLRHKSKPLRRVDAELHKIVRQMFDLMYEAQGVGLAANQVDLPWRLFVVNIKTDASEDDEELVFINPVLSGAKGTDEAEEGCLSLPKMYGDVRRPAQITIEAFNLSGEKIHLDLDGLLGRIVQHENDHLDGVLFVDRLSPTAELAVREDLVDLESRFQTRRELGEIGSNEQIAARLAELEAEYC
ncbi:MAG: peptide deformylase [Planctomycetes bacterium]|nr:peptide deformylase [Planctomycetota bacterium]